jgi:hypothetical protein
MSHDLFEVERYIRHMIQDLQQRINTALQDIQLLNHPF